MVFCGKPSKACQRCRDRKLKCDLRKDSCSACIRAQVVCTGYRDTSQLRIRNESLAVQRKQKKAAAARTGFRPPLTLPLKVSPSTLPLPIELEAREAFFISRIGYGWEFLHPYYNPFHTPEHVSLSIEAVALAYLSHQAYSEIALNNARERYVAALRLTNHALQSPQTAAEETTLVASLLLDLFEKITNDGPLHDQSWIGHVNGALALVRLRGLENFTDRNALQLLVRLSTNLIISCVASDTAVPEEVRAIRTHAERYLDDVDDPKWRGTGLTMDYTALRADIRSGLYSTDELLRRSIELDQRIHSLTSGIPEPWSYKRVYLDRDDQDSTTPTKSDRDRIYENHFDIYADRHMTQAWNVMRLSRILINEWILEQFPGRESHPYARAARQVIVEMAKDICAAAPQYTDCAGTVIPPSLEDQRGVPIVAIPPLSPSPSSTPSSLSSSPSSNVDTSSSSTSLTSSSTSSTSTTTHTHTPSRHRDVYTLIFPLYVAAWSRGTPPELKSWIVHQLQYMAEHFGVKNAGLAARILKDGGAVEGDEHQYEAAGGMANESENEKEDRRTLPWAVYAMLGSYAFAAC